MTSTSVHPLTVSQPATSDSTILTQTGTAGTSASLNHVTGSTDSSAYFMTDSTTKLTDNTHSAGVLTLHSTSTSIIAQPGTNLILTTMSLTGSTQEKTSKPTIQPTGVTTGTHSFSKIMAGVSTLGIGSSTEVSYHHSTEKFSDNR